MSMKNVGLFVAGSNADRGTPLSRASDAHFNTGTGPWTVGLYFRANDATVLAAHLMPLMGKWQAAKEWLLFVQNTTPPLLTYALQNGATTYSTSASTGILSNTDYYLFLTFDGTSAHIYLNGPEDATALAAVPGTAGDDFYIGGDGTGSGFESSAWIGQALKFSALLDPGQMDWIRNSNKGRNVGELLANPGLPAFDFLYGFEDNSNLGKDSGPHGLDLGSTYGVAPTQGAGPNGAGPTGAAVTCPASLTVGASYTATITTDAASIGGTDFYPSVSGFTATITEPVVTVLDGTTTISFHFVPTSAVAGGGGLVTATAGELTVTGQAVTSSAGSPAVSPGTASGPRGGTQAMTATGFTGGGVTWSSGTPGRVTIDGSTGVATYVGTGSSTITATGVTNPGESATATLTGDAVGLSLDSSSQSLAVGATHPIVATVTGAVDTGVTYGSSASGVASVNSSGVVTAVSAGSATITATSHADSSVTATLSVTVTAAPLVTSGVAMSEINGFTAGLVPGTTPGFGIKVAEGNNPYGALITSASVIVAEEESGAYSAFPTVTSGQPVRVKWYDGSGRVKVDGAPVLPAGSGGPAGPWYADYPRCQTATANTLKLATTTGPEVVGQLVTILTGPGSDQWRMITAYDAASKVATVDHPWTVTPPDGSYYGLSDGAINLMQGLMDVKDATIGGAMNAAHLTAFCEVMLDKIAGLLKVYSHGSPDTPIARFTYEDVPGSHTSRVPE